MRILLVGGGSGGPVAPLLAVAEQIKRDHPKAEFLLVGTRTGPERQMAGQANIPFVAIVAGKWRRYFSLANFLTPFFVVAGFFSALKIISNFKPDCVFGAGSFVQVPVVWAARLRGVPVVLHQQDILPGLSNRICQYAAKKITVTFEGSLTDFSSGLGLFYEKNKAKIVLTGNPFRRELAGATKEQGQSFFRLKNDLPALLVLGGGTGALFLNELVEKSLPELCRVVQVIHSTGRQKGLALKHENYRGFEFISDMAKAYAAADIVLCRAGLSTITELSNLGKVAIVVPMPDSHQELNAFLLYRQQAAIVLDQNELTSGGLIKVIRRLLFEHQLQQELKKNIAGVMPKNSAQKIADIIVKLAEK